MKKNRKRRIKISKSTLHLKFLLQTITQVSQKPNKKQSKRLKYITSQELRINVVDPYILSTKWD
jgi:hypothetical protein